MPAPSNRHTNSATCYCKHENMKKHAYEQRILEIERSSFAPVVLSAKEGLGPIAPTMNWLRCRLSFSLLRSAIEVIRPYQYDFMLLGLKKLTPGPVRRIENDNNKCVTMTTFCYFAVYVYCCYILLLQLCSKIKHEKRSTKLIKT